MGYDICGFLFWVTLVCILLITVFAVLFIKKKSILGEFIQASYRGSAAVLGVAFMVNIYGSKCNCTADDSGDCTFV